MNPISRYFSWLQSGNFTGRTDQFPLLDDEGQTSVPGIYVIGDLTGIPLLKLAAESGKNVVDAIDRDPRFRQLREGHRNDTSMLDIVIVGAGPAGISAGMQALDAGHRLLVLEASRPFATVADFPHGKPIFSEPAHIVPTALLQTPAGTKESLLTMLESQLAEVDIPLHVGETVVDIERAEDHFIVTTQTDQGGRTYRTLRVLLAIGKSGSARKLGIPGEEREKVFNRLIDPKQHRGERILVVGGGDSALETAIALAESGNSVTIAYRGRSFSRPKQHNLRRLEEIERTGRLQIALEATPIAIDRLQVTLRTPGGIVEIENDTVFVMIGRTPPLPLLDRCGIAIQGAWGPKRWLLLLYGLLFAGALYFGKKSTTWDTTDTGSSSAGGHAAGWGWLADMVTRFASAPARSLARFADVGHYGWYGWRDLTIDLAAWISLLLFVIASGIVIVRALGKFRPAITSPWQVFKITYLSLAAIIFCMALFGDKYFGFKLADLDSGTWYSLLYSTTIVIFGLRRIHRTPTRYVKLQTYTLMAVQVIPLFLLPVVILPFLWKTGVLGPDSWLIRNAFPVAQWNNQPEFWRAYGLVLAWPLFLYNVFTDQPTAFWLVVSFIQTFVIIPLIVWKWGKGAYCGWICSCGGLAETLGDEYRTAAPHGPTAKRWENAGQWVLLFVTVISVAKLAMAATGSNGLGADLSFLTTQGEHIYSIVVDILFAGVLGLGVYFVLSGRVWCRFLCPLAALMHIYARFTRFRIFAAKERCISCNVCTSVCHMGIDVMNYANKGIPMNDVECVRCSACVTHCPMDVLSFGELPQSDPGNRLYLELPIVGSQGPGA